ncbi:hypothetical protein GCM10010166_54500 [Couchioplanes caeruleus subsp. azureus]|nr:hypothetical protein GCM10010166_54500 [Couchioplanes caeruleus subsp. azureus]
MTLAVAATSTNTSPNGYAGVAMILLIAVSGYGMWCWIKPFADCDRCDGRGTSPRRLSDWWRYHSRPPAPRAARGARQCPRCRGTGLRLRLGRRAANHLIRRYRHSHPRTTRPVKENRHP